MDQVHVVRHKVRVEKLPIRRVARDLGISRNTVKRYLQDDTPIGERRASSRPTPVRDAVSSRVSALLSDSGKWTAGKQRLTATRLHAMLVAEGLAVGATLVKACLQIRRDLVQALARGYRHQLLVPDSLAARLNATLVVASARPCKARLEQVVSHQRRESRSELTE